MEQNLNTIYESDNCIIETSDNVFTMNLSDDYLIFSLICVQKDNDIELSVIYIANTMIVDTYRTILKDTPIKNIVETLNNINKDKVNPDSVFDVMDFIIQNNPTAKDIIEVIKHELY